MKEEKFILDATAGFRSLTKKEQYKVRHYEALREWRVKAHFRQGRIPRTEEEKLRVLNHQCVQCGVSLLPNKRLVYCSDACRQAYWIRHDWSDLRAKVLKKADYTCSKCGFKPEISEHGYSFGHQTRALVVDHIVPIALGGEEFDESNLQVLCFKCDKEKTRIDRKKIRKAKRGIQPITYVNPFYADLGLFLELTSEQIKQKCLFYFMKIPEEVPP
jgi:hypothetical protein